MEQQDVINLLTVSEDADEANRLANLLRNAELRVDPHYVTHLPELDSKLAERNWDLALVQFGEDRDGAKQVLQHTRRMGKDMPVILTVASRDPQLVIEGLKLGAVDVIATDDEPHLILVARRTLRDLSQRRQLRYWQRRFSESESRFEQVLASSRHGIAVIQEGMYVFVNDAFAHLHGYDEAQQLELMPVFDTLAKDSQPVFRSYLKPLDPINALEACTLHYDGLDARGELIPIHAECSQIDFRSEPALQLLIKAEAMDGTTEGVGANGGALAGPGDIRVTEASAMVDRAIRNATRGGADGLLWYLEVDGHEALRRELGISLVEEGIQQLAAFLVDILGADVPLSRIREDAFVCIVAAQDHEVVRADAAALLERVGEAIFETGEGSFTCTLSIGMTPITELATSVDASLSACQLAIAEWREQHPGGGGVCFAALHEHADEAVLDDSDRQAIARQLLESDGFEVLFQPVIPLHGHPEHFYSTQIRLRTDGRKAGLSDDFLSLVRQGSAGPDFDRHLLRCAATCLADKKRTAPQTRLFFELSDMTLLDETFPAWLAALTDELGLAADDLVPQIRETAIGRQLGKVASVAGLLAEGGFRVALSHFGLAFNPTMTLSKIKAPFVRVDSILVDKASRDARSLNQLLELIGSIKEAECAVIVPDISSAAMIPSLWQARVDFMEGPCVQEAQLGMEFDFGE